LYRFFRAVARLLLEPEPGYARLLPLNDQAAQQAWRWASRLIALVTVYFVLTRLLLTIGVAEEVYHAVRGVMILVLATVVSVLLSKLRPRRQGPMTSSEGESGLIRPKVWAEVRRIWPSLAIIYVWGAALLAMFAREHGMASLLTTSLLLAVFIGAAMALIWAGTRLFQHAAALNEQLGHYIPGLEKRTRRYLQALWWSGCALSILAVLVGMLRLWGTDITWLVTSPLGSVLLSRLLTLVVTVACVICVVDLSTFISEKLVAASPSGMEPSKKRKTLVPLAATVLKYATLLAGGLIVLHQMGINTTPILAGVGIFSLAVGFGAQTLVKDMINGLFMLIEDSIAVGDVVSIRGTGGLVEAVNLRTIRLRDLQGNVHIIPNSQVDIITNMAKEYAYHLVDIGVSYHEDTDEVIAALQAVDAEMQADAAYTADMLAPIEILGVDRFTDSAVVLRARLKTRPLKQWSIGREFNRRMKKLFDARGIEIPFPQRTISWGKPKRRGAEPLRLHVENLEAFGTSRESRKPEMATGHQDHGQTG
jgi:small conductance mechanosensitive channel